MNNFFEHQDKARQTTRYLVFLFCCAIAFTVIATYAICILLGMSQGITISWWEPAWLLSISVIICCIVSFGSLTKTASLKGGGAVVARSLGGRVVSGQTDDAQERQLLNVVEEMAIAAGVAVPQVYRIPEASINAFAAGLTPNDAVIGVTDGCLAQLNREQLQGVIAHEFSHIVNGDMALNIKIMGVVHGLLLIHLIGREFVYSSARNIRISRDEKNNIPWFALAFALMAVGAVSWVFGLMIKSAVSRQREFLADASAVQFTRSSQGIADALRRIAQQSASPRMLSSSAESASHLFFNDVSLLGSVANIFATHPPLAERIRRLGGASANQAPSVFRTPQPVAVGPFTESGSPQLYQAIAGASSRLSSSMLSATAPLSNQTASVSASASAIALSADSAVSQIGTVTPAHLAQSQALLKSIPAELIEATRSRIGSTSIIYGLLLSPDSEVRSQQKEGIARTSTPAVLAQIDRLEPALSKVNARQRLPLLELCIPSLKTLPIAAATQLFSQIKALVQADGKLTLTEFALQTLLQYRLAPHFRAQPPNPQLHSHLDALWPDCWTLISALAQAGHPTKADADYAFRNGLSYIPGIRRQTIPNMPSVSLYRVSKALGKLRATTPQLKQAIADACAHTVLTDGQTTEKESELLRVILIALDCPIPPFLDS